MEVVVVVVVAVAVGGLMSLSSLSLLLEGNDVGSNDLPFVAVLTP